VIEVLPCGNRDFQLFCSCDLDLDPMTFIYELEPYSLETHWIGKYELSTSRFSKVIVCQIDRQTDRHNQNYVPCCSVGGQQTVHKCIQMNKDGICVVQQYISYPVSF